MNQDALGLCQGLSSVYDNQAGVRGVHGVVNVSNWIEGSVEN